MKKHVPTTGYLVFTFLVLILFLNASPSVAEDQTGKSGDKLLKLEAEILEVEELKEPLGSAIYTVKDLSSNSIIQLYEDRYRTLVRIAGSQMAVADVFGGGKATIIYRDSGKGKLPEVVFARIANAYYA